MRGLHALAALLLCLAAATVADAGTKRALLIGVTGYTDPALAALPPLQGPANDIALMHRTIDRLWGDEAEIRVLADAIAGPDAPRSESQPTARAILAALREIADSTRPGDSVLLYLSGHGIQLSDPSGDEADGLDEAFLPIDATVTKDGADRVVSGHIPDDALGAAVSRITAAGGSVWLIADICHAATLHRGGAGFQRRSAALLAPGGRILAGTQAEGAAVESAPAAGAGFVGFYAAPPAEPAFEGPMPPGDASAPVHGLLTWALATTLAERPADSYQSLARAVRARLAGAARPVFSGALAGAPMLGAGGDHAWSLAADADGTLTLAAGALDGVRGGLTLAIHAAGGTGPLFLADTAAPGLTQTRLTLRPESFGPLDAAIAAEGLTPARFRTRWLAQRAPRLEARPIAGRPTLSVQIAAPTALATRLPPMPLRIVPPGTPADAALTETEGGLALISATGRRLATLPAGSGATPIAAALTDAARSIRLRRVLSAFSGSGPATALTLSIATRPGWDPCPAPPTQEPAVLPAGLSTRSEIRHCDTVFLKVENHGTSAIDATLLYLAPTGARYFLGGYRGGAFEGLRVPAGGTRVVSYVEDLSAGGAGAMEIALIATEAAPGTAAPRDFRHLASGAAPPPLRAAAAPIATLLSAVSTGANRAAPPPPVPFASAGTLILPLVTLAPGDEI